MARLEFSILAESDLRDIADFIALDNPTAAIELVSTIKDTCQRLASFPDLGVSRPRFQGGDLRSFAVERYLIFYQKFADGILIARVLHGARDIDSLLE